MSRQQFPSRHLGVKRFGQSSARRFVLKVVVVVVGGCLSPPRMPVTFFQGLGLTWDPLLKKLYI